MANCVDTDETARYKPSHVDLHCLQRCLFWSIRKQHNHNNDNQSSIIANVHNLPHFCLCLGSASANEQLAFGKHIGETFNMYAICRFQYVCQTYKNIPGRSRDIAILLMDGLTD